MRLWHILLTVLILGTAMGIARDEVGRVALTVFIMGLAEMVLGVSALMTLFRTFGAIGSAQTLPAYVEAFAATAAVLFVATVSMCGVLFIGVGILQVVVK